MNTLRTLLNTAGFLMAVGYSTSTAQADPGEKLLSANRHANTSAVAPKAASPTTAAYKTEEVQVSSPNSPNPEVGLGGTLTIPLGSGPFPAVVLLSDIGTPAPDGTYSLLNTLADYLTRQGIAVLRLDDRGTGRSAAIPSANADRERTGVAGASPLLRPFRAPMRTVS